MTGMAEQQMEYVPGARVRYGILRHHGTVERSWYDEQRERWKYDVRMDVDKRLVTVTGDDLTLGTVKL